MIERLTRPLIFGGILVVCLNVIFLFGVLPTVFAHLPTLYGENLYADGYDLIAQNLVAGNGYRFYPETARTLMREPGYPFFLAGIFTLFGENFTVVKLANMLLALGTGLLILQMARRFTNNQKLILASPLLFLFHPATLVAETRGGIEILFTFLLALFVVTLIKSFESNAFLDYIVAGEVLGLAVLVRSTPLLFPFAVFFYLFVFERRKSSNFAICRNVGGMIAAMFFVLSPWIIRNYDLTGKFIPTASVLGVSAHAGQYNNTHHVQDGDWWMADREASRERRQLALELGYRLKDQDPYYQDFYSSTDEVNFSNYLLKKIIDNYRRSPMLFVHCLRANLFNFWFAGKSSTSRMANMIVQLPLIVLSLLGIGVCLRQANLRPTVILIFLILYLQAVSLPILAQARYSIPLIPYLSIFMCIALFYLARAYAKHWLPDSASHRGVDSENLISTTTYGDQRL